MPDNIHLIIHNTAAIIATLALVYLILFLLFNNFRKSVNITLALTALAYIVFLISHVWGVSVSDPYLSRNILMWNLSVIFISIFNFHCVMSALNRGKEKLGMIIFVYTIGIGLTLFYILFPDTFILPSESKMYFPNYYVPGQFHWIMRVIFQIIIPIYFVNELIYVFRHSKDRIERNRILYFTIALSLGWLFGLFPLFLIFNIPIDPLYGIWSAVLFILPFTYAVLKYELLDIKIVAQKAFYYGITTAIVTGLLISLNFSSRWVEQAYPGFPLWLMPLISAVFAVCIGIIVWRQLRRDDLSKYEFITTVTHKFRTPLTHIKWAAEDLSKIQLPPNGIEDINYIRSANDKLVELTDILANVSDTDNISYEYKFGENDLSKTIENVLLSVSDQIKVKKINIVKEVEPGLKARYDSSRLKFVIQVILENAINYTAESGNVHIKTESFGKLIRFSVKDTGIGLKKEDMPLLFSKFYRGSGARLSDTEGMGIGLYIAKRIIGRHRGKIWAESEGRGRGSTFIFTLPAN